MKTDIFRLGLKFGVLGCLLLLGACSGGGDSLNKSAPCSEDQIRGAPFGGGSGTGEDPYQICSIDQLKNANEALDKSFVLLADLDFASYSGPQFLIGSSAPYTFSGVFDGNAHTISDYKYKDATETIIGLFSYSVGTITNLKIVNVSVEGQSQVGGLVGRMEGGTVSKVTLSGTISGQSILGGIVGYSSNLTLTECVAEASFSSGASGVGGLVGFMDGQGVIQKSRASAQISGQSDLGGLVGAMGSTFSGATLSSLSQSSFTGSVVGSMDNIGGLVGSLHSSGQVSESYAVGSVTGHDSVGGLIGRIDSDTPTIKNSYHRGSVTGTQRTAGIVAVYVGGDLTLENCYQAEGTVSSATGSASAISGGSATVLNSFADGPVPTPSYFSKSSVPLDRWDFSTVWAEQANDYPALRWQNP